jgi:hypothetical protein
MLVSVGRGTGLSECRPGRGAARCWLWSGLALAVLLCLPTGQAAACVDVGAKVACCDQVWSVPERRRGHAMVAAKGTSLVLFGEQRNMDFSDEQWTFDMPAGATSGVSDQREGYRVSMCGLEGAQQGR